jgi:hypothetical protein
MKWAYTYELLYGARGSLVVMALCYRSNGRGSETPWGERHFSMYLILPAALGPGVLSKSTTSRKIMFLGREARPVRRVDNRAAACVNKASHNPAGLHGLLRSLRTCLFLCENRVCCDFFLLVSTYTLSCKLSSRPSKHSRGHARQHTVSIYKQTINSVNVKAPQKHQ